MSDMQSFDWNEWYDQFGLPARALSEYWPIYPLVVANRQVSPGTLASTDNLPLSRQVITAIITARQDISIEESFEHYLETGEIAAAAALLEDVASSNTASMAALHHRVSQVSQNLELQFVQRRAQIDYLHRTLVALGTVSLGASDLTQALDDGDRLFRQQRIGRAVQVLLRQARILAKEYQGIREELGQRIIALHQQIQHEQADELRARLLRDIDRADALLQGEQLIQADRAIRAAEILLQSRDLDAVSDESASAAMMNFRDDFPDIKAHDILVALDQGSLHIPRLTPFVTTWSPTDWRTGQRPTRHNDPTYPIYEALRDLGQLSAPGCPYPFSQRRADYWSNFLKDLFDLIGKRGQGPSSAEALATRSLTGGGQAGFWLGRCHATFTVPSSFLDPARLPDGLPVVLWHRPNDPLCPKPANLHNELFAKKGLILRPILVIAGDQIAPEIRDSLHRSLPTAALLDERDLLQIIFCSDQPEVRAMHFARAIAWQYPANLASPYTEQGDVSSALFVGREDVLREFIDPAGPTILYGGRKLGKSSIFRQIERMFTSQGETRIAVYFNAVNVVNDIGIERSMIPELATRVNQRLRANNQIWERVQGEVRFPTIYSKNRDMCEEFTLSIRRLLTALPDHRFLFLIDEADSLLQYLDTTNDPLISSTKRFGWTLRGLVQDSGGRFDVRFAGFQEISRVAQSQSGPFYNFRPGMAQRALTVLQPGEARDLILRPLHILRATLLDESLVEFILDVTGQHPALIQAFCGRLYQRARGARRSERISLNEADVEVIWQDPQFRKEVIRAIHLNVDTRDTRPEKILRLVLYLWVHEIMSPSGRAPLPLICEPIHLYQLLCDAFTKEAVDLQIRLGQLDNYLEDLVTLGVLAKMGRGYVFRYRYFANLLYYDHFGGQLGDTIINELWVDIVNHSDLPPRFQIQIENQLSISPFTREEQSRLEQEQRRVVLALGAPGTGKTEFFRWLETNRERQGARAETVHILDVEGKRDEVIRTDLARAMSLPQVPQTWQQFMDLALNHCTKMSRPVLIILDGVNTLADPYNGILIEWRSTDQVVGDEGLLYALARITNTSQGQLRFILAGAYPLARLWVEWKELLADIAIIVVTQSLRTRGERDAWFDSSRLYASDELKDRIWRITAGDWRLLTALRINLHPQGEMDLSDADLQSFQQVLQQPESKSREMLERILTAYDPRAKAVLQALAHVAQQLNQYEAEDTVWSDLVAESLQQETTALSQWSPRDIRVEILAAILLQELDTLASRGSAAMVRLPVESSTWFKLLINDNG